MAAICQLRRAEFRRSRCTSTARSPRAKPSGEAIRALKRQISNAVYRQLGADALYADPPDIEGPGGQLGSRPREPARPWLGHSYTPPLRRGHSRTRTNATPALHTARARGSIAVEPSLDTERTRSGDDRVRWDIVDVACRRFRSDRRSGAPRCGAPRGGSGPRALPRSASRRGTERRRARPGARLTRGVA